MSEQEITEAGQADGVNLAEPVPGELSPPPTSGNGLSGVEDVLPGGIIPARIARTPAPGHETGRAHI